MFHKAFMSNITLFEVVKRINRLNGDQVKSLFEKFSVDLDESQKLSSQREALFGHVKTGNVTRESVMAMEVE